MFVAQTVTIGEQKVFPESESLKFYRTPTPTPQVENPSDSDSTALVSGVLYSIGFFYMTLQHSSQHAYQLT